jgi:predicted membrane channel-forming protein YqfA (hemolysin III family)
MKHLTEKYLRDFLTFPWALGGGLYIFGACMYMLKVPERFMPGFFDILVSLQSLTFEIGPLASILPRSYRDSSPCALQG